MSEWQPIETAPKDGTPILGHDPGVAKYFSAYVMAWEDFSDDGGWTEAGGEQHARFRPTHWMPLPEPPSV